MASTVRTLLLLILILFIASTAASNNYGMSWMPVTPAPACQGTIAECTGGYEYDVMAPNMMSSMNPNYISYDALKRDAVPCSLRGNSYYNCKPGATSGNPYTRGCSAITQCRS